MPNIKQNIQAILQQLPEKPGVYQYFDKDGKIIYIGKAKNLKRRVSSYFQKEQEQKKTRQLVQNISDLKYVVVETEQDAFLLENNLIKQYQPHYNILLKDGKTYPSICITKETFPRIYKTRNIDKSKGEYYGPYCYGNTLDLALELIHKIFPLRTCNTKLTDEGIKKNKYKVCLKYHLKTCCGICENYINSETYNEYINGAKKIIRGDAHELSKEIYKKMQIKSENLEYEEAKELKKKFDLIERFTSKTIITNTTIRETDVFGYEEQDGDVYINMLHIHNGAIVKGQTIEYKKLLDEPKEEVLAMGIVELRERLKSKSKDILVPFLPENIDETLRVYIPTTGDKKKLIELAMKNVAEYKHDKLIQLDKLNPEQRATRVLGELQRMLKLIKIPLFIDSFDNSNLQGTDAVAGCVVFRMGKPSKKEYKRYIIKDILGQDDYANMREVVRRRYQDILEENSELPDLIIADGGIGQMNAIREVIEKQLGLHIPIVGLKKNGKHKTNVMLYGFPPQEIGLKVTDEVFKLMVHIQEEVHKFAISYHRQKRSKGQTKSQLDEIKGIGEVTKQKLLVQFKSVNRVKSANLQELVKNIGNHYGSIVYKHFHNEISL